MDQVSLSQTLVNVSATLVALVFYHFLRGYLPEKGHLKARSEDREVLADVEAMINEKVEQVKMAVSDAAWSRRAVWDEKRLAYAKTIECMQNMANTEIERAMFLDKGSEPLEAIGRYDSVMESDARGMRNAMSKMLIFGNKEAVRLLSTDAEYEGSSEQPPSMDRAEGAAAFRQRAKHTFQLRDQLIQIAKEDLGVKP